MELILSDLTWESSIYTIRGLDPATQYFIKVTAHNTAGSSVAEYPFSTLTLQGLELPRLRAGDFGGEGGGGDPLSAHTIGIAIKVILTVLLSVAFIVASFYLALFFRRWKHKRDVDGFSHDGVSLRGAGLAIKSLLSVSFL